MILKKVGHQYKKIKNKKEEKIEKEKDLSTYNKQYNQWEVIIKAKKRRRNKKNIRNQKKRIVK